MANVITLISIVHDSDASNQTVEEQILAPAGNVQEQAQKLGNFFSGLAGGAYLGTVRVAQIATGSSDRASLALTIADVPTADDTVTIGGVVFTWKASPSGQGQVAHGASATAAATNLVAKINAHDSLAGAVVATSAAGVVTVSAALPGKWGNLIAVSESGTNTSWAGGATALAGGDGVLGELVREYDFGGL
jgi:hypothetical protein